MGSVVRGGGELLRRFGTADEHQLVAALELAIAGFFESGGGLGLEQVLFAPQLRPPTQLAAFAQQYRLDQPPEIPSARQLGQ